MSSHIGAFLLEPVVQWTGGDGKQTEREFEHAPQALHMVVMAVMAVMAVDYARKMGQRSRCNFDFHPEHTFSNLAKKSVLNTSRRFLCFAASRMGYQRASGR